MKPLTRKERIYATALGMGLMWKTRGDGPLSKSDMENVKTGLALLADLANESDLRELKELAKRAEHKAKSPWPDLTEGKSEKKQDDAALDTAALDSAMHCMTHHEAILFTAIGIAKLMQAKAPKEWLKPGVSALKRIVTASDVKWAKDKMVEACKKCGCDECKGHVEFTSAIEEIKEVLEKQETKTKEDGEDPFQSLSA